MRTISRGVTGAVLVAMSAIACTSESDSALPNMQPAGSGTVGNANAALAASLLTEKDMIVIYRDQMVSLAGRNSLNARASAFAHAHAPVIAELNVKKVRDTKSFALFNGFQTKLTADEVETLSARSEILAVVPNGMLKLPKRAKDSRAPAAAGGHAAAGTPSGLCNTLEPEALQVTHTAFNDSTTPSTHNLLDGNGQKITGKGVKVAFLADGMNPHDTGFTRADGTPVFIDYQDFSGDGPDSVSSGAEAYGDASSIAAQDTQTFDINDFVDPSHKVGNGPCNIRIRGMAPGASLIGLKIFSDNGFTTEAGFVQAIEYAVAHGADVINESFGGNPVYDDTKDPVSLANSAAIRAGVTVVASTGDAGTAGTIGSPATSADIIAAGGSTTFRVYQQTGDGIPIYSGYASDNISSISSGGFAQRRGRTVDMVAPADLGWSYCSADSATFYDCVPYSSNPTKALPLQVFGGTSESSPLISGAAALVIQAYRSTHNGADPSPALVKSILASTAHDLGAPSNEQGAGLVDTLKAATLALSVSDQNAHPASKGDGLLASPSSFNFTAQPYDILAREFDVTNTGSSPRVIEPALQKLGAPTAGQTVTVTIDPNGTTYSNVSGAPRPYTTKTFNVPAGLDHLDASIAWAGTASQLVAFELIDPSGKLTAYSIPQGAGQNYAHVDVVKPVSGQWKAAFRTSPAPAGYTGPIKFTWAGEKYVTAGIVLPPVAFVAPGQSAHFYAALATTGQAGDVAAAVRFGDDAGEIPVTVRTLIGTNAHGGSFAGTLTGGNGRGDLPTQTYAVDVPAGLKDLGVKLTTQDAGYSLIAWLVDPNGKVLSAASSVDLDQTPLTHVQLNHAGPEAGRWSIVVQTAASAGTATSSPFSGEVEFDKVEISAPSLPNNKNTKLSKSAAPLAVPVHITNNGATAKSYFADARLKPLVQIQLPQGTCADGQAPSIPGYCGLTIVPPRATAAVFLASTTGNKKLAMDASWYPGFGPDLLAKAAGPKTVAATIQSTEVPYGLWEILPGTIGPYGAAGAPTEDIATDGYALVPTFDDAVTSDAGNYWSDALEGTATYTTGLVLQPGQSGTIHLKIGVDDAAPVGKVVKGFVSVDTINFADAYSIGDEVMTLPYEYTVKK